VTKPFSVPIGDEDILSLIMQMAYTHSCSMQE